MLAPEATALPAYRISAGTHHFPELQALRQRLVEKSAGGGLASIEGCLAGLIDALEAAWQRAETEIDFGSYSDKHADMQNLAVVQTHLEETARALDAACRERLSYYRW